MNSENEFIVVLPSNTPSSIKNTSSNYLTTFDDPIYLDGEWNVALMEIMFKSSIKTITNDSASIYKIKDMPENIKETNLKHSSDYIALKKVRQDLGFMFYGPSGTQYKNSSWLYLEANSDKMLFAEDELENVIFRIYHEDGKNKLCNETDYTLNIKFQKSMLQILGLYERGKTEIIKPNEVNITMKPKEILTGKATTHVVDNKTYVAVLPNYKKDKTITNLQIKDSYAVTFSNEMKETVNLEPDGNATTHLTLHQKSFKNKKWYFLDLDSLKISLKKHDVYLFHENNKIVFYNNSKHSAKVKIPVAQAVCLGFLPLSFLNKTNENDFHELGFIYSKQGLYATHDPLIIVVNKIKKIQWMSFDTKTVQCHITFIPTHSSAEVINLIPNEGWYPDLDSIVAELNKDDEFKKYCEFIYNKRLNRFQIKTKCAENKEDHYYLQMNDSLREMLGFKFPVITLHNAVHTAESQVDRTRGINTIFIYCDLVDEVRVGNTLVPLLRTVPFNSKTYGDMISITYDKPIYLPIRKNFIDNLKIELRDSIGELIPFDEGLTTLMLHFKRI